MNLEGLNYKTKVCYTLSQRHVNFYLFCEDNLYVAVFCISKLHHLLEQQERRHVAENISYFLGWPCVHCFPTQTNAKIPNQSSVLLPFRSDLQVSTPKYFVTAWKNLLYSHPLKPLLCKTVNLENTMLSPSLCRFLPLLSLWKQSEHQICQ